MRMDGAGSLPTRYLFQIDFDDDDRIYIYIYISRIKGDGHILLCTDMVDKWEGGRRIPPDPKLLVRKKIVCK